MRTIHRHISDEELLALFRQTEKSDCFRQLYERYLPLVYGVLVKYVSDLAQAREMVMQLFEQLPGEVKQAEIVSFRPWLYSRVRLFCRKQLPETVCRQALTPEEKLPGFGSGQALDRLLGEHLQEKKLLKCIEELPEKQRITVYRFFMENRSCREIEESTGFPGRKVWSYLQSGRRAWLECLDKKGLLSADAESGRPAGALKLADMIRLYFRSGEKGRMANRLERDALSDPFLYEALEGLREAGEDPVKSIALLRGKLKKQAGGFRRNKYGRFALWGGIFAGMAVLVLCLTTGKEKTESCSPVQPADSTIAPRVSLPAAPVVREPEAAPGQPAGEIRDGSAGLAPEEKNTDWLIEVDNTSQPGSVPVVPLEAYNRYIRDSLRYPSDALEQKLSGKIKMSFIVNRHGRPSRIRVVEWINHSCNHEAIRLLDKGPVWSYTGSPEPTCLTITFRYPGQSPEK
ncbi:MAG: energy transducer TonB [Culturomica sp.]|nr:energy transducer TonB [Culturomica sp.]